MAHYKTHTVARFLLRDNLPNTRYFYTGGRKTYFVCYATTKKEISDWHFGANV